MSDNEDSDKEGVEGLASDFSDEEKVQVIAEVPEPLKDVAFRKLEHGEWAEKVRELLNSIAFGDEITERALLENEIEHEREEIRELRSEKRDIENEIQDREDRVHKLQRDLEQKDSREDKFEGALEQLEWDLRNGTHIDKDHPKVTNVSALAGIEQEGVMKKLHERNPDVPPWAFEQKMFVKQEWEGVDPDLPLEKREPHPAREDI